MNKDLIIKSLGVKPQPIDNRDFKSLRFTLFTEQLPSLFELPIKIGIYDQGSLGSCTANSGLVCFNYEQKQRSSRSRFKPSRLFLYYNTRAIQGWEAEDSGAYIRDVFKTLNKEGVCSEVKHPYLIENFANKPSNSAYKNGKSHTIVKYAAVNQDLNSLKKTLLSGAAISFGFLVKESFFNSDWQTTNYIVPIPTQSEAMYGGHAVTIVGYDDVKQCFKIQNSWGVNWGDNGYFYMPYEMVISTNDCFDFWCIEELK